MTKNEYQQLIIIYTKRREIIKKEIEQRAKVDKDRIKHLSKKIKLWYRDLRRIDKREDKVREIIKLTSEFTGLNLRSKSKKTCYSAARNLVYKYAIEHKLEGDLIAKVMGLKYLSIPSKQRLRFTRSFKDKPENRELWHRFNEFMKSHTL